MRCNESERIQPRATKKSVIVQGVEELGSEGSIRGPVPVGVQDKKKKLSNM